MTPFGSDFDRHFERTARRAGIGFGVWFGLCALASLAVVGVAIWAVVRLVLHFT